MGMASTELRQLYKLHLIDREIVEIRKRAQALDPGRKIHAEILALEAQLKEKAGLAHDLHGEEKDLELKQQALATKVKKIETEMYGGKLVSPREIENLSKELALVKAQRSSYDDRLFELMELVPPAQKLEADLKDRIALKKKELEEFQKQALVEKSKLEAEFGIRSKQRPAALDGIAPLLLSKYEAICKKLDGVAMTEVTRVGSCASCGTMMAEKIVEGARDGKVVTCDGCHRIVYVSDGLI